MEQYKTYFSEVLDSWGLELTEEKYHQFVKFYEMLVDTNKHMNLTTITEPEDVVKKHFLDSLAVSNLVDFDFVDTIVDIGTGGGFPGIPLKIMYPEKTFLLVDSLNKRIRFLNEVIASLGLEKIEAIHGRAEEIGKNNLYREGFDLCVSRAVANLSTLSELCLPLVKVGGMFVSYKSGTIEEEFNQAKKAIRLMGGRDASVEHFSIAKTDMQRSFVMISKAIATPKKYPRNPGTPGKMPILGE
mgnify:FL=1